MKDQDTYRFITLNDEMGDKKKIGPTYRLFS